MANPILQMLNSGGFFGGNPQMQMLGQFMQIMRGRNPEVILQNFIRQRGITPEQYRQVEAQAKEICRNLHLK